MVYKEYHEGEKNGAQESQTEVSQILYRGFADQPGFHQQYEECNGKNHGSGAGANADTQTGCHGERVSFGQAPKQNRTACEEEALRKRNHEKGNKPQHQERDGLLLFDVKRLHHPGERTTEYDSVQHAHPNHAKVQ